MVCHPNTTEPWEYITPTSSGTYAIFGSQIQFMEIEIPSFEKLSFKVSQVTQPPRQDASMRLFISKTPYGQSIQWNGRDYFALRTKPLDFIIEDFRNNPDTKQATPKIWAVEPGVYYINIKNIENSKNSWKITFN